MPIEFREVRRGEIDDAVAFAVDLGATVSKPAVRHQLSLQALNAEKTTLGSALHEVAEDGRRSIHIHLKPDVHPGLGRLLIDRALRKAEAVGLATAYVAIHHQQADELTWCGADWPSRLKPTSPKAPTVLCGKAPLSDSSTTPKTEPDSSADASADVNKIAADKATPVSPKTDTPAAEIDAA
ncbi:MAG: hypothetical protein AAGH99_15500 [Planctomycetota bacterium]